MSELERLANEIMECAAARGLTICTAESCSAGRLALALSKMEGASEHFMGGVVAYTKEMKIRMLDVPQDVLRKKTAVSADVAEAMAVGAVKRSGADVGVSITGVAGPEPDEDGNPVGLVYCAVAHQDGESDYIKLYCKSKKSDEIIDEACEEALKLLRSFSLRISNLDVARCDECE
jgi:nicotinamide-nucleotide amidase